jgi:hypothetical protein
LKFFVEIRMDKRKQRTVLRKSHYAFLQSLLK